jgi:hypothetical protein
VLLLRVLRYLRLAAQPLLPVQLEQMLDHKGHVGPLDVIFGRPGTARRASQSRAKNLCGGFGTGIEESDYVL